MPCFVDDRQLVPWERRLVAEFGEPRRAADGGVLWDLDALPAVALRALCRPRPGVARALAALAGTATP